MHGRVLWALPDSRFLKRQFTFTSSRSKRGNSREKSRHETAALRRKTAQNRLQDGHTRGNRHNFASSSQLGPNRCIIWRILTNFELVDAFFVRFGLLPSQKSRMMCWFSRKCRNSRVNHGARKVSQFTTCVTREAGTAQNLHKLAKFQRSLLMLQLASSPGRS